MTDDERDLDQDLRDVQLLDPAHDARPGAGGEPAAQALLDRILDAPQSGASSGSVEHLSSWRRWRRWAVGAAAAAAVAVGLLVVPPWGAPEQAFATWTAAPLEVPVSSVDELGEQCTNPAAREALGQEAVLAEQRGRVTFVVTATPYSLRYCLLVDGEPHNSGSASSPGRSQHPELAPAEVHTYMAGGNTHGPEAYTAIVGRVGEDVVGVEVHPLGPVTEPGALPAAQFPKSVTATVDDGYYGAWWPGATDEIELTIHLADGTVLPNVPAFDNG